MLKPLLLLSLVGLPLPGAAQTTPTTPRFYVGAGAALLTAQPFNSYSDSRISPALTVGWQFRPRLTLQLSSAYTWQHGSSSYSYSTTGGLPDDNTTEYHSHIFTLPLLLRGELTAPTNRLHVDALVGTTLLLGVYTYRYTSTYQGQTTQYDDDYSHANATVSLGPALRYSFSPRVEATADALVNLSLESSYFSFSNLLFSNVMLGLRYRFGE